MATPIIVLGKYCTKFKLFTVGHTIKTILQTICLMFTNRSFMTKHMELMIGISHTPTFHLKLTVVLTVAVFLKIQSALWAVASSNCPQSFFSTDKKSFPQFRFLAIILYYEILHQVGPSLGLFVFVKFYG